MGKLLRVMVVILFLLGIVALALGIMLFQKRETLKGHVTDLAAEVVKLAPFIEDQQDPDLTKTDNPKVTLTTDQLLAYKDDPKVMKDAMALLIAKATSQYSILTDTRNSLAQHIKDLEVATNRIIALEANIVTLEGEKKQLQDSVAGLEKTVSERNATIEDQKGQIETAKSDLADMKDQRDKLKDAVADREDQIKSLNETIQRQQAKINELTGGGSSTNQTGGAVTPGTKGKLLLVNKAWNFVIIGLDSEAKLNPGVELTIQRGDKMVGKVRVSDVNEQYPLAIGDVLLAPWKQADPEVGDSVFY